MNTKGRRVVTVYSTLLVGLLLTMFPLPSWLEWFRPDWVALIIVYWCITMPMKIGLSTGFTFGLLLDIALGTLFGQHAWGLTFVSFAVIRIHTRLRVYPLAQQGVVIMFILFIKQLIFLWIYGITNRAPDNMWIYFLPCLLSMLLWPAVFMLMHSIERRFLGISH